MLLNKLGLLVGVALMLTTGRALAQHEMDIPQPRLLEEIVVTADLQGRSLLKVPSSVGIITNELIEKRAARHLDDVLQRLVNVQTTAGSNRSRFYQIRGIGEREQYVSPLNSSVGLLIDDVDFSGAAGVATLLDVEQVEVLRGPQGTRYGAGAIAGLINLRTREPTRKRELRVTQEFSTYGGLTTSVALGSTIARGLLGRIAMQRTASDGYNYNEHLDRDDVSNISETSVRGKLRWLLREGMKIDFHLGLVDADNGYDAFSLDNNRVTRSDEPGRDKQHSIYGGAKLNWALSFADLTAVVNYGDTDIDYGYDEDWTYVGFHPDGFSSTDRYQRDRENVSGELRLVNALSDEGGRFGWLGGVYYHDKAVDLRRTRSQNSNLFTSNYGTEQLAAYGEVEYRLRGNMSIALGGRVEAWEASYSDSDMARFAPSETLWGGHLTLQGYTDAGTYWYAKVARASKAGGFNAAGVLSESQRSYDAEALVNLEAGARRSWPARGFQTEVAVFHMERENAQLSSSLAAPDPAQEGATIFAEFTGNAANASNTGMEISASWAPNERWLLEWQIGILDTNFSGYVNATGDTVGGRDQSLAPNWQANVVVERYWGDWTLRYERQASDGYFFSEEHQQRSLTHQVNHIWLGLERKTWELAFWVRNFTNQSVRTQGFFFGNDPRDGFQDRLFYQLGEPRRLGVTVSAKLGGPRS